jgi:ornithine--oxo-acid transaminase
MDLESSLAAKKLPVSKVASSASNVKNVSTKFQSLKRKPEEEIEQEELVQTSKKNKLTSSAKKVDTQSLKVAKKGSPIPVVDEEKNKSKKKKKVVEEENEEELDEIIPPTKITKVTKVPKKPVHTLQTTPEKVTAKTAEKVITKTTNKVADKTEDKVSAKKPSKTKTQSSASETTEEETKQEVIKRKPTQKKKVEPEFSVNKIGTVPFDAELDPKKYTTNPQGTYVDYISAKSTIKTKNQINLERQSLCYNYAPLPVICSKGHGIYLQDIDGINYVDFLSAYSAVNHGHCNENVINAAYNQMKKLHMTSRAFYNDVLGTAGEIICKLFQYEKVLFMNSGVEAGESAIKIARRWGYVDKKIPKDQAKVVFANGNFWGRSLYACATSDDPSRYAGFGPFDHSSHYMVDFGEINQMKEILEKDSNICAIFIEPIQGENGVVIPPPNYFPELSELCKKHNVLLIFDEVQTGIGRTGYLLCSHMFNVQPDIVLLGKSLSAGLYPVSAVLTSSRIMDNIKPGEHGSTYGGNPLAARICIAALQELFNDPIIQNSFYRGVELGILLKDHLQNNRFVKQVRGRGLMYAIELWPECGYNAYDFSLWMLERGILCKPTKEYTLR